MAGISYLCLSASKNISMIRLSDLSIGQHAVIREFEQDDIYVKLMEMGCVPGEKVSIVKVAPLGDPISIAVAGYNLSLRRTEANHIWVEEVVEKVRLSY